MFDVSIFPKVKRITGTFVLHTTRYNLPSVAQQADLQSPQRSVVPSLATLASDDTKTTSVQPPPTSQLPPTATGTPPLANSSTTCPPSRRLRSFSHTPDPQEVLASVLHVTDFNNDYL
eukprot:6206455-Pleurochrysis_carterae.AAC.5